MSSSILIPAFKIKHANTPQNKTKITRKYLYLSIPPVIETPIVVLLTFNFYKIQLISNNIREHTSPWTNITHN